MKRRWILRITLVSTLFFVLIACGRVEDMDEAGPEPVAMEESNMEVEQIEDQQSPVDPSTVEEETVLYRTSETVDTSSVRRSNRMIIKNAELVLLVSDTEVAIDRTTQVIEDVRGYIISSRVWYEKWGTESYKYSSITIGIPAEHFERTLRRLREIAIKVTNESAYGEDVTDQYVDLQSQSTNLEATRDRIIGFLERASTVEEALAVNEELTKIEGQIEDIQGQINYLADRSAYSTISITIEPELPEIMPSPTPTLEPTATPVPWEASKTYTQATRVLSSTYKGLADLAIWLGIVIVPVLAPPVLVVFLVWRWKTSRNSGESPETKQNT